MTSAAGAQPLPATAALSPGAPSPGALGPGTPPQGAPVRHSAIYTGWVTHHRREPVEHRFRYRGFQLWLDLDELPGLFSGCRLWSYERTNVASFRRRDYLGDPGTPLKQAVLDEVEQAIGRRPAGPVRMLTHLRYFGFCINPVTFYYCYGAATEAGPPPLEAICAEVTNTPWKERHRYTVAIDAGEPGPGNTRTWEFPKEFHVSPFHPMEQRYRWTFAPPGEQIAVHMVNLEGDRKVFEATLGLTRQPMTPANLNRCLRRHPWMTAQVWWGIHRQAFSLWRKRVPFHTHPRKRPGAASDGPGSAEKPRP